MSSPSSGAGAGLSVALGAVRRVQPSRGHHRGAYTDWFNYDSNGQRAFERLRQVDGSNNVLAKP